MGDKRVSREEITEEMERVLKERADRMRGRWGN